MAQLLAYQRVALEPGESVIVTFDVPTARLAFTGRDGVRIVEPGTIRLWVGPSCDVRETESAVELTGAVHVVTAADARVCSVRVAREVTV